MVVAVGWYSSMGRACSMRSCRCRWWRAECEEVGGRPCYLRLVGMGGEVKSLLRYLSLLTYYLTKLFAMRLLSHSTVLSRDDLSEITRRQRLVRDAPC